MAIVRLCFDADTHTIYAKELCYEKGRLTAYAADVIRKDILNKRTLLYEGEDWSIYHYKGKCYIGRCLGQSWDKLGTDLPIGVEEYTDSQIIEDGKVEGVPTIIKSDVEREIVQNRLGRLLRLLEEVYCDPARPEQIYEMRTQHDINSVPATNTDKVGRIEYLKYFNVKYIGDNLREEYENYKWLTDKKDTTVYINKPQDGNDHCFTADTMITTDKGQKRIIDVCENNDKVLTSQGYQKVFKLWDNGEKEIWRVRLSFTEGDIVLNVTPNHKVKTLQGWKEVQQLKRGELLYAQPYLMEEPIISIKEKNTSHNTIKNYTERCGNFIMEKFQKGITYTIKTAIALIMLLITLFAYLWQSIIGYTQRRKEQEAEMKEESSISILFGIKQPNGIKAKQGENGTDYTQNKCNRRNIIALVLYVVKNMCLKRKVLYTAVMRVMQRQEGVVDWIMRKGFVLFAEEFTQFQNSQRQKPAVVVSVLKSVTIEQKEIKKVYDLTIVGTHEYYANGLLVHNCLDAVNYAGCTHLRRLRVANKIGEN